jgi:hypothetical protein
LIYNVFTVNFTSREHPPTNQENRPMAMKEIPSSWSFKHFFLIWKTHLHVVFFFTREELYKMVE